MRLLLPLVWSTLAVALRLPITARSVSEYKTITNNVLAASDHESTVRSTRDVVYLANVTIDGNTFPLQMDTGSSDLWVDMGSFQPPNPTTITYNLTYGTGWAYGTIARGPVSFAGYNVADQAYLAFQSGNNPVLNFGASGIIGLGMTTLSHIDSAVDTGTNTWGRSLLYNIFAQNPSQPNFIAMALERSSDAADTVQGSLGIGEVADEYASVSGTDHIPLFPPSDATRWTVMLDSYAVDGKEQTVSSVVPDAPEGRAIVLLDSGTTYTYAPPEVAQSIYSSIPGAVLNTTQNMWTVPCSAGVRLTIWIAGRPFDIHPLDTVLPSLGDSTQCIGSIMPQQLSVGSQEFDWILGTNILRSIYAVYDFGDFDSNNKMGDPYVQLLSVVDINQAASDFQSTRGGTVNTSNGNGNASPSVTVLSTSDKLDKLMNIIPLIFAVLGANALILLNLLIIGVWLCCYLRKQKGRKTKVAPLPLTTVASSDHAYEAVPTADNEGRPSSIHTRHSSRAASRTGSKYSLHQGSPSQSSLLRPTTSRDDDAASIRSGRVPVGGGSGSRRSSRLTPPREPSPVAQRSSRIPDNLIPPSPTTPTIFTTPADEQDDYKMKKMDDDMKDVSLMAHEKGMEKDITDTDSITSFKKRSSFRPPPPISVIASGGVRMSVASDVSNSPTVAGSEAHYRMAGPGFRDRTISTYSEHPLRQSSLGVDNAQPTGGSSPTDSVYQDARQSYYSHPNDSLSAVPNSAAVGPSGRSAPTRPPPSPPIAVVPEEPSQEASSSQSRSQHQEAQRAAFMAALEEPLPPPRRPRVQGYGYPGAEGDGSQRMSAYQHLSPSQEEFDAAQMNRHSYAAPGPSAGVGTRGFIQNGGTPPRSPFNPNANGQNGPPPRRGPFLSNPSPFNPNASPQSPQPQQTMNSAGSPMVPASPRHSRQVSGHARIGSTASTSSRLAQSSIPASRPASHLPPPANQ